MVPVFLYHRNGLLCMDFTDNHFTVSLYLYISSRSCGFIAYELTNCTEHVLGTKQKKLWIYICSKESFSHAIDAYAMVVAM